MKGSKTMLDFALINILLLVWQVIAQECKTGCHIGSEDSYGSLWYPTSYNYTVATVIVVVYKSTGQTSTAVANEVSNRTEAFLVQSKSLVNANRDLRRGALIINGDSTSFLGTTLKYPSSDLRVAKFTAYSTFLTQATTGGAVCTTTSSVYARLTNSLWLSIDRSNSAWLRTSTGICNPCPNPGQSSQIVTRLGDLPSEAYIGAEPTLKSCTTATMDDNPITRVALVATTLTTTSYVQ